MSFISPGNGGYIPTPNEPPLLLLLPSIPIFSSHTGEIHSCFVARCRMNITFTPEPIPELMIEGTSFPHWDLPLAPRCN